MFSVGEKIVYPMHGAGVIESIEPRVVGDKTVEYYKVRITSGNIMLMIPVKNPSGVQLRSVITKPEAEQIIENIGAPAPDSDIPWNKRHKYNMDRLRIGSAENVAQVLSELINREKTHGLSTSDRKMFVLAKNILCSELSVAVGLEGSVIFENILAKF